MRVLPLIGTLHDMTIIIDELSMIPQHIFNHILKTLIVVMFRPVILLQQPFCKQSQKIMQLPSALDNINFIQMTYHYNLKRQHRVGDECYFQFLDHIRHWIPNQCLLDGIQRGHVISKQDHVTDNNINEAFKIHPETMILTFTRHAANHVNQLMTETLFKQVSPAATLQLDGDFPPSCIYVGKRVVIT